MNKLFKKISNVVVQDVINLVLEANQQQTIKPITSTRKIFIFSGRFQPFHINHYNVYKNICNKFGTQNVFIATSDNTKSQNSPFGFQQKKKIMTTMFNIPENNIFMVRKPYNPQQILKKFNPQKTIYFAVVGEKDSERLKNGAYFIPPEDYKIDQKFFNPFQKNGYIYQIEMQTPAYEGHIINGSLIREIFSNDKYSTLDKQKIFNSLYGNFNQQIFRLFINKFGGTLNQNLIYAISKLPSLLKQGGSYGHIKQLYADHTLSFGQLKQIIKSTISGQNDNKITQVSLKVDGRNMSISYKNGRMIAAISDEQTRNNGANALSISNFQSTINNRQHYKKESKEAYIIPFKMLNNIFNTSNKSDLNWIFQQGRRWISLQLISVDAPMLIPYDRNMIQFHGIFQSGTDPDTRVLETGDMYDFVNSILNVANNKIEQYGKTYQLMIPQLITWPKPKKPLQQLYKYLQQIDELMSAHSLSDSDTIGKYLKHKWKDFIVKTFGKITPQMLKEYLISAAKENSKTHDVKEFLTDFYVQHLDKEQIKKTKQQLFDKHILKLKKEQVKIQKSKKLESPDNPFMVKRFKSENNSSDVKEDVKKHLLDQYVKDLEVIKKNILHSATDSNDPNTKRQQDKVKQYQKIQGNQELLDKKAEQLYNKYIKTEAEQAQNQLQKNLSDPKWIARKKEQLFSKYLYSIDSQKLTKMFQDNMSDEYVKEKRNEMGRIIFNRFTKEKTEESKNLTQIKNIFGNEIYKMVQAIEAEKGFKEKEFIRPLQMIITSVQREILDLVWAKLQLSGDDAVQRITKMIRASIAAVKKSDDSNLKKRLDYELEKLKQLTSATQDDEALKHLLPMEGVAFRYGNKQYKFTGLFAPINQLFGAIRWNDKLISELDGKDSKTEADIVTDEVFNALAVENKAKLDPRDIEFFHYTIFDQKQLNFEKTKESIVNSFKMRQRYKNPIRNEKQYEECIKKIQESKTKEQLFKNSQQCEMLRVTQGKASSPREMSDYNKAIQNELSKQVITNMCTFLMGNNFGNFAELINEIYSKNKSLEQKKNLITKIIHNRVDTRLTKLTNMKSQIEKVTDKSQLDQIVIKYLSNIMIYSGGVFGVYSKDKLNDVRDLFNTIQTCVEYVSSVVNSKENLDQKKKNIIEFVNYVYEQIEGNYNNSLHDKIQTQQGTNEPRQAYIRGLQDTIKKRNSEMDKMKNFIQHRILNANDTIVLFDTLIIVCRDLIKYDFAVNQHIRLEFVQKYISQLLSNVINTPNLEDAREAAIEYVAEVEGLNKDSIKSPSIRKVLRGIELAKDQFGLAGYLYYMFLISKELGVHQRVEDDVSPMFSSAREQAKRLYHYRLKENEVLDLSNFAKEMKAVNELIGQLSPTAMEKLSAVMNKDLDQRIKK